MKGYTNLEQSHKLAEFLPLESADMRYEYPSREKDEIQEPMIGFHTSSFNWFKESDSFIYFPCWSLTALISVLPNDTDIIKDKADTENEKYMCTVGVKDDIISTFGNNPVDACYEMITRLNELNLLYAELKRAAEEYEEKSKIDSVISRKRDFINGANWKEEQITRNNMLLPFKEYDNLMESVNKQKKEGYEAGYKKGLEDAKEDTIKKVRNWLEDNFYYHDTIEEKYDFINDLCEALENDTRR